MPKASKYAKTLGKGFSPLKRERKMPLSASKNKILKSICYLLSAGIAEYITQLCAKIFCLPCTECYEMSVVCRSWDRDRSCTADVGVAELVGEALKLVGFESEKD